MVIYLYKKTHNITGLQYLGKTASDPYKYRGSGKYWTSHLKVHGNNVTTVILKICNSNEEIRFWGMYYSELWNIVNDATWANLRPEDGDGGRTVFGETHHMKREEYKTLLRETVWTEEKRKQQGEISKLTNSKLDKAELSRKLKESWTPERKEKLAAKMRGNNPMSNPDYRKKISESNAARGPEILAKISGDNHYKRKDGYVQNQAGNNHPMFDPTIYTFCNKNTGITEISTAYDLRVKYRLNQGNLSQLILGHRKTVSGWFLCR